MEASDLFALTETLCVFMFTSKAHKIYLQKQSELYPFQQLRRLQGLSDMRWACRYFAIDAACSIIFDYLVAALEVITGWDNSDKAIEAEGILLQVRSFKFLQLLVIFSRMLSLTSGVYMTSFRVVASIWLGRLTYKRVQLWEFWKTLRSDSKLYVKDVASLHNIHAELPRPQCSSHRYRCMNVRKLLNREKP